MRPRALAVTWLLVAVVFLALLIFEFSKWRALSTEVARAGAERQRLTSEIQIKEGQLVSEMRKHSTLVQEMQWTASGADPTAFLTRLAELAREKRMMVMAIGPLERQSAAQFTKSWHSIQVRAPYREIRELAARVEQDRGILEDVHLEATRADQRSGSGDEPHRDEVLARFRLTSLELSAQAKQMVERTLAASGGPPKPAAPPLALPVPTTGASPSASGRDPFTTGPRRPGPQRDRELPGWLSRHRQQPDRQGRGHGQRPPRRADHRELRHAARAGRRHGPDGGPAGDGPRRAAANAQEVNQRWDPACG